MLTEYLPGESRDGDNLVEIVWLGEEGSGGSRSLTEEAGGGGGAGAEQVQTHHRSPVPGT